MAKMTKMAKMAQNESKIAKLAQPYAAQQYAAASDFLGLVHVWRPPSQRWCRGRLPPNTTPKRKRAVSFFAYFLWWCFFFFFFLVVMSIAQKRKEKKQDPKGQSKGPTTAPPRFNWVAPALVIGAPPVVLVQKVAPKVDRKWSRKWT
jgi:hypothetical protein